MNLKEQVINCMQTKEEIDNLKMEYVAKKRRLFDYVCENIFSNDYVVKKVQVSVQAGFNPKASRIEQVIYYADLNVQKGFEKMEEVVMFSNYIGQGVSFLLRKYTVQEIESDLKIHIREEIEKAAIIPRNRVSFESSQKKDNQFFVSYIKYVVKIEDIQFEFTKDYKREFVERLE